MPQAPLKNGRSAAATAPRPRPRLLVVHPDADARRSLLATLGGAADAPTVEEALAWLDGRPPGVTLLAEEAFREDAAAGVVRLREAYPAERVVVLSESATVEGCRAALRAGVHDLWTRAELEAGPDRCLEGIAGRLAEEQRTRETAEARGAEAVRRHEQEALARLAEARGASDAWSALDLGTRRRWMHEHAKALASEDPTVRAAFVSTLGAEAGARPGAAELLAALHVHSLTAGRLAGTDALEGSREVLLDLLLRAAAVAEANPAGSSSSSAPDRAWHRWRFGGEEWWFLVLDARPRALLRLGPGGVHAAWTEDGPAPGIRNAAFPPPPAALREVEDRVGCPPVLRVLLADEA